MRFYTNFRDIGYFVDLIIDSNYRGLIVLCIAIVAGIGVSLFYANKRR